MFWKQFKLLQHVYDRNVVNQLEELVLLPLRKCPMLLHGKIMRSRSDEDE